MLKTAVSQRVRSAAVATRHFCGSSTLHNPKVFPSTPQMKSGAWTSPASDDMDVTKRVMGMARSVQHKSLPPITVEKSLLPLFQHTATYNPFDFSMTKTIMEEGWNKRDRKPQTKYQGGKNDIFNKARMDPRDLYLMPEILSRFLSPTGQVLPRQVTGCTDINQKKLGIAIKRARVAGLLSYTGKHGRFMPKRLM
ncbi:ribosomal protein S18 [Metschnikowia bicuspidata]|uniref:Small ribosomal subunit protein bS18m n=1 Tax=Metschnikowia bicuspidata TaxID=27322 RepID=A0A4V1J3K2_9ASCO|nr:ribosomal protein S18 [Metschnikowia bicuspidata]